MPTAYETEIKMSFGENLKRLRREKGWTQAELAEKADLKSSHIPKLEGKSGDPKLSTIYKLMEALGCSADSLITDSSKMSGSQVIKAMIERIEELPEQNKNILLHVIDQYCIAAGIEKTFSAEKKWFHIKYMTEATSPMVPNPNNPMKENEKNQ
ncbi:helix-turn-helix transcriptional regulator [Teredinibacter sp. KSP-S5-2]|uniref:helix-turn-helix domain-containing protein n=1 Tax=Teredinibacter sp. KSP-S5-2 TaxID=3034506 RepID=UPI002934A04E|nr:helix-turn-helix transcriptional regulator [Teredinibacter sp. KSP-S5-2]WNO11423.1 helix-turn-helix transcriptional regulator [Teredinibacter sp. KSP-S5-2]WNO11429.1 helix-turn-helix transcriptional regulator [Teredinibacter sp. KSP-S5-2]